MSEPIRTDVMEAHGFKPSAKDDYLCHQCGKCRAVHLVTDFVEPGPFMGYMADVRIRSGWNAGMLMRKGMLTDKAIAKYEERGFYSDEFREARRNLWAKRSGNFVERDGRMVYSPR